MMQDYQFQNAVQNTEPVVIFMGQQGAGKTTIFNLICGTNFEAGLSKNSVTCNLFKQPNIEGDNPFYLIDTPGTGVHTEVYKHAYLLVTALTYQAINTIFVVVQHEDRTDDALMKFNEQTLPLQ